VRVQTVLHWNRIRRAWLSTLSHIKVPCLAYIFIILTLIWVVLVALDSCHRALCSGAIICHVTQFWKLLT
jgi:hypothetical protein